MERKLFDMFSGRQLTLIACVAILAPSVLVAFPSFTNVAIIDPNSGYRASVDTKGRVFNHDTLASYANDPKNLVDIYYSTKSERDCPAVDYKIPRQNALVVSAVTGYADSQEFELSESNGNCGAKIIDYRAPSVPVNVSFGSGIGIPAGHSLYICPHISNYGVVLHIHGYLVPAAAIPAPCAARQDAPDVTESGASEH